MKITPSWVATFETNTQTLIQDAWARRNKTLVWDLFMDTKQSGTGRELYFWLLETARIRDEAQGGNKRFDDIAATYFEIVNKNSGDGLTLTKNEIEDNMMAGSALRGMPALDYAANWARQKGGNAAYWPQEKLFELVNAGKGTTISAAYDGRPFFDTAHPINPFNVGLGTYANLLTGAVNGAYPGACPIDTTNAATLEIAHENFANAVAYVEGLTQPNGLPRGLKVKYALSGTRLRKRLNEILSVKYFGTGQGSTENVIATYGIEPVIVPEIPATSLSYALFCEMIPGEGGPFIFQDREPYVLTSYQPATQLELQIRKEFTWSFDGRNSAAYGHPYLCFWVDPT